MYMSQLTYRYLASNQVGLIADLANNITEYRPVYQRTIQLYRGIDNTISFEIKNSDQKPVSILNTYTPKLMAFDENNVLILEKTGTILETSTPSKKGQFKIEITANDLLDVKQQYVSYNVFLTKDSDNTNVVTYADSHFGVKGTMMISSEAFPGPSATYSINTFTEIAASTGKYTSEAITAEATRNGNSALHTAALYSTNFTGDVDIQGTLDNQVTNGTPWGTIATVSLANETQPKYVNFNGVYSHLRIAYTTPGSGTLDKVLVRN
jgi:hypothetical protein